MSAGKYLGKWEVKNCKTTKAYSICKKYIGPKVKPEVVPKVTDPCPPGWHSGSGLACYKVAYILPIKSTKGSSSAFTILMPSRYYELERNRANT